MPKNIKTNRINKIIYKIQWMWIRLAKLVSQSRYVSMYENLLRRYGMNIKGHITYIDPSVYFDNYDYSMVSLGNSVTISRNVLFLVHDFSVGVGLNCINRQQYGSRFMGSITIGDSSFIGARSILLPGTSIGDNCIIGAGAVIKGNIPNDSIVVGNPAKIIANTKEWGKKHFEAKDYI